MTPRKTHSTIATGIVAMLLLAIAIPLVTAGNGTGEADGLVVVAHPRAATLTEDGTIVNAISNLYIFDFELFDDSGNAFPVSKYIVDVNTVDPDGPQNPDFTGASLVWSDVVTPGAPTNKGTIRVPASAVAFHETPFAGIALTILAWKDAAGNQLHDDEGRLPGGQYNVVANRLASEGRWAEADQADEGFTPIFLVNGQPAGLIDVGNPLLNPGFEAAIFTPDQRDDFDVPMPGACGCDFATTLAPWFLYADNADADGSHVPASKHFIAGAGGQSGSMASIHYDPADNGRTVFFGQYLSPPWSPATNAPDYRTDASPWETGSDMTVSFDVQVRDDGPTSERYHAGFTLHWIDAFGNEAQLSKFSSPTIPADGQWHHVTYDFSSIGAGYQMTFAALSLNLAADPASKLVIHVDNFVLDGAKLLQTDTRQEVNDGYSSFIFPHGANTVGAIVQDLVALGDGRNAYVFELAAMDYTGINPKVVNVPGNADTAFSIVDEASIPALIDMGGAAFYTPGLVPYTTSTTTGAGNFFQMVTNDGSTSERLLVIVDAAELPDAVEQVTAWMWTDIRTGDNYDSVFGAAEPTSALYSPAHNNLMGWSLADHMDYAFAPMRLSGVVGASAATPTVELLCPAATPGSTCSADPTPTLDVTFAAESRVIETVTIELVASKTGDVIQTATVDAPSGMVSFTLLPSEMDALRDSGDMRVEARAVAGAFTTGAISAALRLDNVLPTAGFTFSPADAISRLTTVTVTDASTDDKPIALYDWTVSLVTDETPDAEEYDDGDIVARSTQPSFTFNVKDDGIHKITLQVIDSDGAMDETSVEFTAINLAPTVSLLGGQIAKRDVAVPFVAVYSDADGPTQTVAWEVDGVADASTADTLAPVFSTDGEHTVKVTVTDDDGASTSVESVVLIDGVAPITTLSREDDPAGGWFNGPVDVTIGRTDEGSGVLRTVTVLNGASTSTAGSADFVRTLSDDGVHTLVASTEDLAGNVGPAVETTIRIDTTAPTVALESPGMVPEIVSGGTYTATAQAADAGSGVKRVVFYLIPDDGNTITIEDADGSDGWSADFDLSGVVTGFAEVVALAYDELGHSAQSASVNIIVLNAGL